jgi:CBS domain-containing protein
MRVVEIMQRAVITVRPEASLREVASLLVEHGISGLPVVDREGVLVGVVSEADFVAKELGVPEHRHRVLELFLGESGADRAELAKADAAIAGEAMTSPAITVDPDASVRDAARIMTDRQINRLPVVSGGRLIGIVSRADLVRAFVRTDDELRAEILEDVIRRALWLDAQDFEVTVTNGVARLRGTIERHSDVAILKRLVTAVPGIVEVEVEVGWLTDDEALGARMVNVGNQPFGPA